MLIFGRSTNQNSVSIMPAGKLLPELVPVVRHLVLYQPVQFKVDNFQSSRPDFERQECNRFDVLIQYCGTFLRTQVVYSCHKPKQFPDLILASAVESGFHPTLTDLKSLKNWEEEDPNNLLKVLLDLRNLYRLHQKQAVLNYPNERISFEVACIEDESEETEYLIQRISYQTKIVLQIPLTVENQVQSGDPILKALLFVEFMVDVGDASLQPLVETKITIVNDTWKKRLHHFRAPALAGEVLLDYMTNVQTPLEEAIKNYYIGIKRRKAFLEEAVVEFERNLVEYDSQNYSFISFCFKLKNSSCFIATVRISERFPEQPPSVSLMSMLDNLGIEQQTSPASFPQPKLLEDFRYDAQLNHKQQVLRLRKFLTAEMSHFQVTAEL
eukprot:Lithocolla_globosa_v1_NODE_1470_length_2547_cov_7.861156.p1 type:complete len:383 gc:universal NODE_1470_length_2547_cov_7.861156:319-1467(+)